MRIKKTYNGVVPSGKVLNSKSTSQNDTYSCEYINEKVNTYSTDEQVIGTWIDGKPIYRKVINFGALPNNGDKAVNHNISNLDMVISCFGMAKHPEYKMYFTIPFSATSQAGCIYAIVRETTLTISAGADRSGFTQTYITLEYTKTTD